MSSLTLALPSLDSVILACFLKGIGQKQLSPDLVFTSTGSELTTANFPCPTAKKSPTGDSTEGMDSLSQ